MLHSNLISYSTCLLTLMLVACAPIPVMKSSMKVNTSAELGKPDIKMREIASANSECYALETNFYFKAANPRKEKGNIADFGDVFGLDIHYEKNISYARMEWDKSNATLSLLLFSQDQKFLLQIDFPNSQILECGPDRTVVLTHQVARGIIMLQSEADTRVTFSKVGGSEGGDNLPSRSRFQEQIGLRL